MKKIILLLLAAFFAVSCAMQVSDKTGSLTLSGARAAGLADDTSIRYSLTRNGKNIPLNGQSVLEVAESSSVTIDSLIPGTGYKLAVSTGSMSGNNFVVSSYGYSETFAIAEGTNSAVSVSLLEAPDFTWLTSSGGKSSAAIVGSNVNVLDDTGLRTFISGTFPALSTSPSPLTQNVNSLSVGKIKTGEVIDNVLWLNTTTGLYQKDGASITRLNNNLVTNVLFSRAVSVGDDGETGIGVYSGGGTEIGFRSSSLYDFAPAWQSANEYPAVEDFLEEITQDVIKSVAVNNDNGFFYVATPLGTAVGSSSVEEIEDLLDVDGENWLKIETSGGTAPIQAVSTAALQVFAASNYGLYTASVDAVSGLPATGAFTLIADTAGLKIVALDSYNAYPVVTAAVTDDNSVLIIRNNVIVKTLPAPAGIPLDAKPLFYENGGPTIHLILSGTNGSIDYDTGIGIDS